MIRGMTIQKSNVTDRVLRSLEDMTNVFMLTGSRYFGTQKDNSDWDFFTQMDRDCEQNLINLGFKVLYTSQYVDYEIAKVMRHEAAEIDVQMVKDYDVKLAVQSMIYHNTMLRKLLLALPKGLQTQIWNLAFSVAKGYLVDTDSEHYSDATERQHYWLVATPIH